MATRYAGQRPWEAQPQEVASPGDRRLRFLYSGAAPDIDLVTGAKLTRTGTRVIVPGRDGLANDLDGSSQALAVPLDLSNAGNAITVVALVDIKSFPSAYHMLWEFTADAYTSAGSFGLYRSSSSSQFEVTTSATGSNRDVKGYASATGRRVLGVVYDHNQPSGSRVKLYLDGALQSGSDIVATGTGAGFANSTLYFGARTASSLWADYELYGFAVFEGALTGSEIADVSGNFWQLLAPPVLPRASGCGGCP